ncbi:MAG: hypothetical protein O3A50_10660 [Planctomycetota bacterium]|nr:hypothetical protein [Planctomycetota bacterium]
MAWFSVTSGFAQSESPTAEVQKAESVEAQMEVAKQRKSEAQGLKGIARIEQLKAAAHAFQAVARFWPKEKEVVAEACFRRGEMLRSLGEAGAARGAFEEAAEAGRAGNDFTARAYLELGHLCRRAFEHEDALVFYRKARDCKKVSLRYNNDGREWITRLALEIFAWKDARLAARDWEKHAEGSVEEVQARDLHILALLGAGDWRKAEKELAELQKSMSRLASAPTREGAQLKTALEEMKALKAIELARTNGR